MTCWGRNQTKKLYTDIQKDKQIEIGKLLFITNIKYTLFDVEKCTKPKILTY